MEPIPCVHCGLLFKPRHCRQNFCCQPVCQKARKAGWQRRKMHADENYRAGQRISYSKWVSDHPGYWAAYRKKHPDYTTRNRVLQTVRNRLRKRPSAPRHRSADNVIAKMDVTKCHHVNLIGQFYLVPVIAKMDVSKVNIYTVSGTYSRLQKWT